jgi:hypothetical protein
MNQPIKLLTSDYIIFLCKMKELWLELCSLLLLMPNTSKLGLQDVDRILTCSFWKHKEKLRLVSYIIWSKIYWLFPRQCISFTITPTNKRAADLKGPNEEKRVKYMIRELKKWVRKTAGRRPTRHCSPGDCTSDRSFQLNM